MAAIPTALDSRYLPVPLACRLLVCGFVYYDSSLLPYQRRWTPYPHGSAALLHWDFYLPKFCADFENTVLVVARLLLRFWCCTCRFCGSCPPTLPHCYPLGRAPYLPVEMVPFSGVRLTACPFTLPEHQRPFVCQFALVIVLPGLLCVQTARLLFYTVAWTYGTLPDLLLP